MRHPKKTYPKVFSIFFGLLAAALILFLGWLSFQPTQPEEPSRTEDTKSDLADESSSAFSEQESDIEVSQSSASLEPASDDGSLDTFVDWVIWYAEQEPQFPVKEDGSTVYFLYRQRLSLVSVRLFLRALVQSVFSLFRP